MDRLYALLALGVPLVIVLWGYAPDEVTQAALRINEGAIIQASPHAVREIETAFNRAEEAIKAGDVDGLMALYADQYRYGSMTKRDVRETWEALFAQYHRVKTEHSFSKILVTPGNPPEAEISCIGSLWATSRQTNERVNLDSWVEEVHFLVKEDGRWRIKGHPGKQPTQLPFGVAPHPLF